MVTADHLAWLVPLGVSLVCASAQLGATWWMVKNMAERFDRVTAKLDMVCERVAHLEGRQSAR